MFEKDEDSAGWAPFKGEHCAQVCTKDFKKAEGVQNSDNCILLLFPEFPVFFTEKKALVNFHFVVSVRYALKVCFIADQSWQFSLVN